MYTIKIGDINGLVIMSNSSVQQARHTNLQADPSKREDEIDQLVYQLYGLTKEEIDIVEGKR